MALMRRSRRIKKRTIRRKRFPRKIVKGRGFVGAQVYPFKRFVVNKTVLIGNDAVPTIVSGTNFTLSDTPNVGEFTALFDQYKIAGVAYRWIIGKDPMYSTTGTAATRFYPRLVWVHDYDDSTVPSAAADIHQYNNCKEFYFSESRSQTRWYYIKPAKAMVGYEGAANSFYSPDWKHWVDMSSTTVPHYGIKAVADALYGGITISLECRYYLLCKNTR